jgi:hypothetical protein
MRYKPTVVFILVNKLVRCIEVEFSVMIIYNIDMI